MRMNQPATEPGWWQILPAVVQSAFWITVGVVTVLTYIHARKTVLQPLRTEVYKAQIELMKDLMKIFVTKSERDIYQYFAMDKLFRANTEYMLDAYASNKFDSKIDASKRSYSTDNCPHLRVKASAITSANEHIKIEEKAPQPKQPWSEYEQDRISIPKEMLEAFDELNGFLKHPLLPQQCSLALQKLIDTVNKRIQLLGETLDLTAKQMEEKYPDLDSLKRINTAWISNLWNRRVIDSGADLGKPVAELIDFTRAYFASDNFFSGNSEGVKFLVWRRTRPEAQ